MCVGGAEEQEVANFLEEIAMMKKVSCVKCCHVVQMVGCVSTALPLALALEFVPFGDLLSYLKYWKQKVKLLDKLLKCYLCEQSNLPLMRSPTVSDIHKSQHKYNYVSLKSSVYLHVHWSRCRIPQHWCYCVFLASAGLKCLEYSIHDTHNLVTKHVIYTIASQIQSLCAL